MTTTEKKAFMDSWSVAGYTDLKRALTQVLIVYDAARRGELQTKGIDFRDLHDTAHCLLMLHGLKSRRPYFAISSPPLIAVLNNDDSFRLLRRGAKRYVKAAPSTN